AGGEELTTVPAEGQETSSPDPCRVGTAQPLASFDVPDAHLIHQPLPHGNGGNKRDPAAGGRKGRLRSSGEFDGREGPSGREVPQPHRTTSDREEGVSHSQ